MLGFVRWISALLFLTVISVGSVQAQATRTWVSGVGDDLNPCSRTAPCKTFAGAISKTAAGGEINVIDPGGFGAVTITKSITIDGGGFLAGVLVSVTNGIVVNAGANDVVILRNLDINGTSGSLSGVLFLAGAALHVENSTISGKFQYGIKFAPSAGAARLSVDRIMVRNCTQGGLLVQPVGSATVAAKVTNSSFDNNTGFGVRADNNSSVMISSSTASHNSNNGFATSAPTNPAVLNLENCVANNNGFGVKSVGAQSIINISNSFFTGNVTGISASSGGSVISFGNNRVINNNTNGAPTGSVIME
jgi:hypothetical protein